MKKLTEDRLLISFDRAWEHDVSYLMVGRTQGKDLYIINNFSGWEADFMYDILTRKKTIGEAIYDIQNKEK